MPIHGYFLLDKPLGFSSNRAMQKAKRFLQTAKIGHTGSLDPLASGLLPLALGHATKYSQYLLMANKTYAVCAQLGATTATGDAEGEIICRRDIPTLSEDQLSAIREQFLGDQWQIPPMYSALKQQGKTLYSLARKGIIVEREKRKITIEALSALNYNPSLQQLKFTVRCSSGTYVRTLVEDIGEAIGCGAYVTSLRRTTIADLPEKMCPLAILPALLSTGAWRHYLLPIDYPLQQWPSVYLNEAQTQKIQQGQPIPRSALTLENSYSSNNIFQSEYRLYSHTKVFLGIAISDHEVIKPKRLCMV